MEIYILSWFILSLVINGIGNLFFSIKLNYYKGSWGLKEDPIFRIEKIFNHNSNFYTISCYRIKYIVFSQDPLKLSLASILLPFSFWIKFPTYIKDGKSYGQYSIEEIESISSLKEKWYESDYTEKWLYKRVIDADNELLAKVEIINKDFNESYGSKER